MGISETSEINSRITDRFLQCIRDRTLKAVIISELNRQSSIKTDPDYVARFADQSSQYLKYSDPKQNSSDPRPNRNQPQYSPGPRFNRNQPQYSPGPRFNRNQPQYRPRPQNPYNNPHANPVQSYWSQSSSPHNNYNANLQWRPRIARPNMYYPDVNQNRYHGNNSQRYSNNSIGLNSDSQADNKVPYL